MDYVHLVILLALVEYAFFILLVGGTGLQPEIPTCTDSKSPPVYHHVMARSQQSSLFAYWTPYIDGLWQYR